MKTKIANQTKLDEVFPDIDCNETPLGDCVIVQLKLPPRKIGNIHLSEETMDQENSDNTVGKVISIGPDAFKYFCKEDGTLKKWPGERWYQVGDYVRTPKHPRNGLYKKVSYEMKEQQVFRDDDGKEYKEWVTIHQNVLFCIIQEAEILSKVIDPLKELTINK
jgi:hypothetical protein